MENESNNGIGDKQPYPQQSQGYYYPPPPRNPNKTLAIIAIIVGVIVIVGVLAVALILLPTSEGNNSKTMWDVVKEYDTNHDGILSVDEISNASLPDYNPGDTIHIRDTILEVGDAHTFSYQEVKGFYSEYSISPSIGLKAGDTYTFFTLQSVASHVNGEYDNVTRALSVVAIPGNLTDKYSAGDTIEFDTKIYYLVGHNINGEFTGAFIIGFFVPMMGEASSPLSMSLQYEYSESTNTKAVLYVGMNIPSSASFDKVRVTLLNSTTDSTGSARLDSSGNAVIYLNSAEYRVSVIDVVGSEMLMSGDEIVIDGGSNSVSGLTVIVSIVGYSGNAQITIP